MQALNPPVTACRYCQHYKSIGRRGGTCEMLNVSVQGVWKGCHLGLPLFAQTWESYESNKLERELVRQA